MAKLSENFTLEELTASQTAARRGINNTPTGAVLAAIGGSSTSAHCRGEAVDFTAPAFGTPKEICKAIIKSGIVFDQLIFEGAWVHIAFDATPRRSVLTAHFGNGATTYTQGVA